MTIDVSSGVTGTWQALVLDHRARRRAALAGRPEPDPTEATRSPEFPGDDGMERLRAWVRLELEARMPGDAWMGMSGAEPFMTDDELDRWSPGWRTVHVTHADGGEEDRVVARPTLDLVPGMFSMTLPLVPRGVDPEEVGGADWGVVVRGPSYYTEEAWASRKTYSREEIAGMVDGERPLPSKPS